jgi:cytochrome c
LKTRFIAAVLVSYTAAFLSEASAAPAVKVSPDEAKAAQALAKKEGCLKCHDVVEKKEAKTLTEISKKYKTKADAEEKILHHMTSGEKVKLDDGTEEEHKIIKTKDKAQLQNLSNWIRSIAK